MNQVMSDPAEQLKLLRDKYAQSLPEELDSIDEKWKHYRVDQPDADILKLLYFNFHKLAGSGTTFGFTSVSSIARILEHMVRENVENSTSIEREQYEQITTLLEALREAATHPEKIDNALLGNSNTNVTTTQENHHQSRLVYLVIENEEFSSSFTHQVAAYGYEVSVFNGFEEFETAFNKCAPIATIMDVSFIDDEENSNAFAELRKSNNDKLDVIFLSGDGEIDARIKAVKAGGIGFFVVPIDTHSLIDKLDSLVVFNDVEPYRILIVDDSTYLSSHYALILNQVGMATRVVNNPLEVLDHLRSFNPELILLDLHMPECEGAVLAKVIRQQEDFVSIPIVYLSGETDISKQMDAMSIGGDDFLSKPIGPIYLLSTVTNRVRRSRILRSFMVRDSLTGLLNHTRTKEMLVIEIERAKRRNASLAYAMIDIDHFKTVNDQFGHPVGDLVIKHLASMLRQRLRKTDIVGRYGGEEFAVILIDIDAEAAFKILDEIRETFKNVYHQAEDMSFNVTLSCGIAMYPDIDEAGRINDAADKALYKAKNNGRDQVMFYDDI